MCCVLGRLAEASPNRSKPGPRRGFRDPRDPRESDRRTAGTGKMAIEIVDLPSYKIWKIVIFHSFLYVYQRVKDSSFRIIISGGYTFKFAFKGFFKDMFHILFLRYGMVHPATLVLEVWIFILGPFQCGIQRYSVFRESGWWDFIYIYIHPLLSSSV